jgi:GT2 family glycosyltransferase
VTNRAPRSEPPPTPRIVVVVVMYGNEADTRRCLDSLRSVDYPDLAVVLVDNGSPDRAAAEALLAEQGPAVTVLRRATNGGFATGADDGIQAALGLGAEFIWCLNNDTTVPSGAVWELVSAARAAPEFGILSPVILGSEGADWSDAIWFAGGRLDLGRGWAEHTTEAPADGPLPAATEFISGCAMFVRRQVLEQVGSFDRSFFLFDEDVDLSIRAQRAGWRLGIVPRAVIRHRVHGTVGRGRGLYHAAKNARVITRRYGRRRDIAALLGWTLVEVGWDLAGVLRGRSVDRDRLRGLLEGERVLLWRVLRGS